MGVLETAQSHLGEPAGTALGLSCGQLVKSCLETNGIKFPKSKDSISLSISKTLDLTLNPVPGDVVFIQHGQRSATTTHPEDPQIIMGIWTENTSMITAIGNKVRLWDWSRAIPSTAPITYYTPKEK